MKLDPISPLWGHQLLSRLRLPFTYLWSESLIPKPADWGPNIQIAGFSFLPQALSYTPPPDLERFLSAGPPPIYIGFGSIVVEDPQALTKLIFEAIDLAQVRAIVSKGWGGIGAGDVPDNIYLIGDCPHDWLFQNVSCVVHHGGAGTTAAGLAAGCSTVVVPFFGDQPFWGQMIARAGAGPEPVPFKKMTAQSLADSIRFAVKPEVRAAAKEVALQISEEDGAGNAAREVIRNLESADLKCDLCPNRLAVYTHKKTGAHLSSFAAYCLANAGAVKVHDLRLLRHKHWYVDEGAESVGIGVVAAFSSFFMEIAMATQDYQGRLKAEKPSKPRRKSSSLPVGAECQYQVGSDDAEFHDGHFHATHLTPKQLEKVSRLLATKPVCDTETLFSDEALTNGARSPRIEPAWLTKLRKKDNKSRTHLVLEASGQYAADVTRAGLKAPITFLYNIANGFRNAPSYMSADEPVRRRDEIKGMKSGFATAGKEFVFGFYDAFSGLILRPYRGAKKSGIKGFGKGVGISIYGLGSGIGAG